MANREYLVVFRVEAVKQITQPGYSVKEVSESVGGNLIRRWKREFEEEASGTRLSA